MNRYMGLI